MSAVNVKITRIDPVWRDGTFVAKDEFAAGTGPLNADLGSCICIGFYHAGGKLGGLCHFAPSSAGGVVQLSSLIDGIARVFARHEIALGECACFVIGGSEDQPQTLEPVFRLLESRSLAFETPDTLGRFHRKVRLEPDTGRVVLYKKSSPAEKIAFFAPGESLQCFNDPRTRTATGATMFFRNPALLDHVVNTVLPETEAMGRRFHVWCAGCSIGMEVYSIAMAVLDWQRKNHSVLEFKILGSDISEDALNTAREGVYPVGKQLRADYHALLDTYTEQEDLAVIRMGPLLRSAAVFRQRDIAEGSRKHRFELVVCDHVLQYFTEERQREILAESNRGLPAGRFPVHQHSVERGSQAHREPVPRRKPWPALLPASRLSTGTCAAIPSSATIGPKPVARKGASMPKIFVTRIIPERGLNVLREAFGGEAVTVAPRDEAISREDLIAGVRGVDALLCILTERIDAEVMEAAGPQLQIIANYAVGFNNINVAAATERGIPVTNTPGVLTETTADCAWTLLMAAARRVSEGERYLRAGKWKSWGPTLLLGQDIHGATLGIYGMGRIGKAMAERARGFHMRVIYTDVAPLPAEEEQALGVRYVDRATLLAESDFVSIHCPLIPETTHAFSSAEFAAMKKTAVLVNTARGPIVDEPALARALQQGEIFSAGLDVFENEPAIHPDLLACDNVVLLPHVASASFETRSRMAEIAASNIVARFRGEALPHLCQSGGAVGV